MSISKNLAKNFVEQFEDLLVEKGDDLIIGDIDSLFKHLKGEQRSEVYKGIENIANKLDKVKVEVVLPSSDAIISGANLELDAVVKAAEDATNQILDSVEIIQSNIDGLPEDKNSIILNEITKIFEACNFQDISGQRINKVINTLIEIDNGINELMDAIGDKVQIEKKKPAIATDIDHDKALMNGPQLDNQTPSQEEIDRLFAAD